MRLAWRFWEKYWAVIKCAQCPHIAHDHRNISIKRMRNGSFDRYDNDWSCKKCHCDNYYREDMFALVECKKCRVKYYACGAGNPDGVAFCPNGHLDHPFEPYCPGPNGVHYTPEEWDRLHGDKE